MKSSLYHQLCSIKKSFVSIKFRANFRDTKSEFMKKSKQSSQFSTYNIKPKTNVYSFNNDLNATKKERNSVLGFYRGYSITIIGMIPYAGLSFSTFERLKHFVITHKTLSSVLCSHSTPARHTSIDIPSDDENSKSSHRYSELNVVGKLICGALTGVTAQTVTYPLDVVRRHMQLATMVSDAATRQYVIIFFIFKGCWNKETSK